MNKPTLEYVETLIRNGAVRRIDQSACALAYDALAIHHMDDEYHGGPAEAVESLRELERMRAFVLDPAAVTRAAEKILEAWK